MKVFVLCGGFGTRLRPYTYKTPKPMLPVAGKPILQWVVENLRENGFTDLIFNVGYLKEQIIDYFGDGSRFGVDIEYMKEDEPLGTAGTILRKKEEIKEDFGVVMGDHVLKVNLREMFNFHKSQDCPATIGVYNQKIKIEYGVVEVEDNRVKSFLEKPVITRLVNTAIYFFRPEVFGYIHEKEDFGKDVLPRILREACISAFELKGLWKDVGYTNEYEKIKDMKEEDILSSY